MNTTRSLPFQLPPLPFALDALEPMMSARTLTFHHGQHHATYVQNLNRLLEHEGELAALELEELIRRTAPDPARKELFENAAQAWNHAFFWRSLKPQGGGRPSGRLAARLEATFGDQAGFEAAFLEASKSLFGSGWVWLVEDGGELAVLQTANAGTPLSAGKRCLLVLDLWEHAYYLDHQNRRQAYVTAYLERLVNWDFAEQNLG